MAANNQDVLARAYAMLIALQKNIAQMKYVKETYVCEFHTVLDRLEGIGVEVSEFRISDSEIAPHVQVWNYGGGSDSYSKEKYVDKPYILTKLDAILGYFEITTPEKSEKPKKIGFRKPD